MSHLQQQRFARQEAVRRPEVVALFEKLKRENPSWPDQRALEAAKAEAIKQRSAKP